MTARFLAFGTLNYIVGNLFFTGYWWYLGTHVPYLIVAMLSTLTASVFSYFTHTFGTLSSRTFNGHNLMLYACVQGIGLIVSALLVPKVTQLLQIKLLLVQYTWSALFSIIGIILLRSLVGRTNHE
jgi:hypothetical protein